MTLQNFCKKSALVFFGLALALGAAHVYASDTNGTIAGSNSTAKFLDSSYGSLNFGLSQGNVHVTDTALTGYAWSDSFGWINLAPSTAGVTNDAEGHLSGYAWGANTGWINFNPSNSGTRVTIDSNGDFNGYAWSANYGWIIFNCTTNGSCGTSNFKVNTDWRPASTRVPTCPNAPNCGGGPGGGGNTDACPNIPGDQAAVPDGMILDSNGNCVNQTPPPDSCPNIAGVQSTLPQGMEYDSNGNCVAIPGADICPNISGIQTTVPSDMTIDSNGNCVTFVPPPADSCPNISGIQPSLPSGMEYNNQGNCVPTSVNPPPENPPGNVPGSFPSPSFPLTVPPGIVQGIRDVGSTTVKIITSPIGSVVTKTISTVGVVAAGAAGIATLFLSPLSLSELFLIPFRLWALLLAALGLKKRNLPWGTVYDSVTKQPLDPAYVTLTDSFGKVVSDSITDLDGRYGFFGTAVGGYRISAAKTNYMFPSQKLAGKTHDELYANLYFGEQLAVTEAGSAIIKNIPLDPINFDWNEFAKNKSGIMRFYSQRSRFIRKLTDWVFRIGFVITLAASVVAPEPYNLIMFGLYIVLIILRWLGLKPKPYGAVRDGAGNPLSFAIIRIVSAVLDQEVTNKVCDALGRYYCLVPNGTYFIKIEKKNPDESYSLAYTSPVLNVTGGIINKEFRV